MRPDPNDLRGGFRAPRRFVGWQTFFDFGDGEVKPNKRIDTRISTPLFDLPLGAIANHAPPTVLPVRTLLRHLTWELPSGQTIARRFGVSALAPADLDVPRVRALLESDPASYLAFDRDWRPTLPSRAKGDFRMVDFLTFAGVDPKSRGQ